MNGDVMDKIKKDKHHRIPELVVLLLSAIFTITICSKCSPIYPLNNWDDPNCFFTVGKSMLNDRVLYRDIFEQKGPLLYMLHSAAYLVSHTSFIGIYFVEIAACFAYLYFSYRTMRLFCGEKILYAIPLMSALTYSSYSFQGGDSAEELCLPFAAYCFYIGMYAVKNQTKITNIRCIIIGISMGVALWFKFTLMGFYIGLVIALLIIYIRRQWQKDILFCALKILSGLMLCTLPVMIYFAKYNAFSGLFEVYFYDNIFLYSSDMGGIPVISGIVNLLIGTGAFLINNPYGFLGTVAGFVYTAKKEKTVRLFYFVTIITTFFFVYSGGRFYAYYPFILSVFSPLGIVGVYHFIKKKPLININAVKICCITASFAAIMFSPNLSLLQYSGEDFPQFRFNDIISQKENPSLLNYGFLDGGFYTVSDIVPDCRFFCKLNIPYQEMYRVQDEYVRECKADFIVTKDEELNSPLYHCADKCKFPYGNGISVYRLYEKIE